MEQVINTLKFVQETNQGFILNTFSVNSSPLTISKVTSKAIKNILKG